MGNPQSKHFEVPAELYTPQAKKTITVEVNWFDGTVSFWDTYLNEVVTAGRNFDFVFVKRGWIFTEFTCKHRKEPLAYKLLFYNRDGDKVRELLKATAPAP